MWTWRPTFSAWKVSKAHSANGAGETLGQEAAPTPLEVEPLQVTGLRARGLSLNEIADKLGVGRGAVERAQG